MLGDFKSEIKLLFLVGIVAIIVAVGGVFLLRNDVRNQVSHTPNPVLNDQSALDTSGWQTYRSGGFEVKYPPTFFFEDGKLPIFNNSTVDDIFEVDFSPNEYQGKHVEHSLIYISVIPTIVSPSQFIELVDDRVQAQSLYNKTFVLPGHETREIRSLDTFDSAQAIQFERMYGSGGYTALHTLIQNPTKTALFDIVFEKSSTNEISETLYNQILSTFRFVGNGFIEGSLGYPSEGIPSNMKVCAEDITTSQRYCTSDHLKDQKYSYGTGYKIEVPVGNYYVFAFLPERENWKAYYSEFVPCGLSVECPSHVPIPVNVKVDETVSGIDPMDWYAP